RTHAVELRHLNGFSLSLTLLRWRPLAFAAADEATGLIGEAAEPRGASFRTQIRDSFSASDNGMNSSLEVLLFAQLGLASILRLTVLLICSCLPTNKPRLALFEELR
ncbi:hypothetical protein, partial [Mesorhizobium sp.]|uniref:hypothetical protein n=1 Tax=Mesorhizobium sp. TaxID=1871066 RepID=UPI00262D497B